MINFQYVKIFLNFLLKGSKFFFLDLKHIAEDMSMPYNLDVYIKKLDDSRKRVTNVSQRLHSIHDRVSALQRNIRRETFNQKSGKN